MTAPIESSGSIKFDDQTFLISYFTEIAEHDTDGGLAPYNNTFRLNNNTQFPMSQMIGIFNGTSDLSPFLKLSTHQYSALVPRVRLYRLDYDTNGTKLSDKEFIFDKDYKYEITDIFKAPKRSNSGIKRINWRLAGTNPVTAETQVEVEIELYFDSINSFSSGDFDSMRDAWAKATDGIISTSFKEFNTFGSLDTDTTTRNYWSLLFHPKIGKQSTTQESRERYDTNFFRIRANVGWEQIETNVKNQLFPDIDIDEEIKKLNYSFLLNLVEHKFNFNEDGSITLTATYFAQFENALHNYNYNILGPLKKALELMKNYSIGDVYSGVDTFIGAEQAGIVNPLEIVDQLNLDLDDASKKQLDDAIFNLSFADFQKLNEIISDKDKLKCVAQTSFNGNREILDRFDYEANYNAATTAESFIQGQSQILGDKFSKISDAVNDIITVASNREKNAFYKELFLTFIENEKIKTLKVSKTAKEGWEKWVQGTNPSKPTFNNSDSIEYVAKPKNDEDALVREALSTTTNDNSDSTNNVNKIGKTLQESGVKFETDKKYISYVNLGDIIESTFQIIIKGLNGTSNFSSRFTPVRISAETNRIIKELSRQNIICGNISNDAKILDLNKDKKDDSFTTGNRNLLDIPIDLKLFKLFLIENIIKPQKDTYSLFSFIKDIITKLVTGALNGSNLYNSQTQIYADTTLATTIFSLGDAGTSFNPMSIFEPYIAVGDVQTFKSDISYHYINNVNTHTDYYTYFLIYDKKFIDFYPNNDSIKDEEIGIYHYTVGQDFGLLKSANFSRIDTPYLKEAKAVGKKTFYLGQFRDRYHVSLTMVGNNIYYPGMMLYVQPSVEAVQGVNKENPEQSPSFSQITGIGGYYFVEKVDSTISEEGYETKLDCIWQYDGTEKPETVNSQEACDVQFSNPNSQSILDLLIKKIQNDAELKKNQQQCAESDTDSGADPVCDATILDVIVGAF